MSMTITHTSVGEAPVYIETLFETTLYLTPPS